MLAVPARAEWAANVAILAASWKASVRAGRVTSRNRMASASGPRASRSAPVVASSRATTTDRPSASASPTGGARAAPSAAESV
ncbi:hypothetical protein Acsp07_60250 [Actinomycetospora sp. NBRC 106378]|nr:hypothetical protein Acsp07_60250 [Actinomycetospora sp. NBRC 106378]